MFKKLLQLKTLLVALLVMAGAGNAWGEDKTITVDFETGVMPSGWTNSNFEIVTSPAQGHYASSTGGKATATLTYNSKIAKIKSVSIETNKTSNNTNSELYIDFSESSEFTSPTSQKCTINKNSWTTNTLTLESAKDGYVRIRWAGTTAVKFIDNIIITYEDNTSTPSASLSSIALSGTYPTTFLEGAAFSHEGMTVMATYSDESTKDVTSEATFSDYNMSKLGNQTVTVSYTEGDVTKTATYEITVNAAPSHNVTWSVNGATTVESYKEGASISFPEDPDDINGKTFVGWVTDMIAGTTDAAPSFVTSATMGINDVTYYAVFADISTENAGWYETAISNITSSDVFVFSNGSYAMPNDGGTTNAPAATSITVEDGKVKSDDVTDALKWNVSGNATDGYTFYPNGSTTTWLYCNTTASSSSNNNIRVGTGDRKSWVFNNSGYLVTNDDYTDRYLSLYSSQDFRGYTGTGNGAFVPKFYKYVGASYSAYCTSVIEAPKTTTKLTIDATGLTNTDVYVNTAAGALAATVRQQESDELVAGAIVKWTSSDTKVATIATDGSVTLLAKGTTTLTATYAGDDTYAGSYNTYELTVTDSEPKDIFYKVTDARQLGDGNKIAIVSEDHNVAMSTTQNSNNRGKTEITIENDSFERTNEVQVITLKHLDENWRLYTGSGYLCAASSSNNYLRTNETADGNSIVSIDITDGNASMVFQGNYKRNTLQYNSNSNLFSCYESASQESIQIYRQELRLSVSAAGYATFSSTSALDFTNVEDIYAYTATVSGNAINFQRVYKVPDNTGLLLRSVNVNGDPVSTRVPLYDGATYDVTDNAFVAATEEIDHLPTTDGGFTNYILNKPSDGIIGFYKANGQKVGAGKAYLQVSSELATRAYIAFSFDDPETGIAQVETLPQQGVAYDLQGRRVNAPKGGLYIINGKKVIVK